MNIKTKKSRRGAPLKAGALTLTGAFLLGACGSSAADAEALVAVNAELATVQAQIDETRARLGEFISADGAGAAGGDTDGIAGDDAELAITAIDLFADYPASTATGTLDNPHQVGTMFSGEGAIFGQDAGDNTPIANDMVITAVTEVLFADLDDFDQERIEFAVDDIDNTVLVTVEGMVRWPDDGTPSWEIARLGISGFVTASGEIFRSVTGGGQEGEDGLSNSLSAIFAFPPSEDWQSGMIGVSNAFTWEDNSTWLYVAVNSWSHIQDQSQLLPPAPTDFGAVSTHAGTIADPHPLGSAITGPDWTLSVVSVTVHSSWVSDLWNDTFYPSQDGYLILVVEWIASVTGDDLNAYPHANIFAPASGEEIWMFGGDRSSNENDVAGFLPDGSRTGAILFEVPADWQTGLLALSHDQTDPNDRIYVAVQ